MLTLPEIVGPNGLITDGDWVESKDQDTTGTVRLTQLADVGDGEFRDRSNRWMNDEQTTRLGVTLLQSGDVLIARMPDPLGRACVFPTLPSRAVTVVDVCIVRAPSQNPKWLVHAINAPQTRGAIAMLQSGSTRKRISKGNLCTVPIPMPARSDQDRIVAAIETHFSRLDAAVASLTRAKANVKRARASVLKAAVEGRLVPTEAELARVEGRDYEPASTLLARILVERKAAWVASGAKGKYKEPVASDLDGLGELPEGWGWTTVDSLTTFVTSGSRGWAAYYSDDGPIFIRSQDINTFELDLVSVAHVSPPGGSEGARTLVERGDVLMIITGANVTVTAHVRRDIEEAYVSQHVGLCRPVDRLLSAFLQLWLRAPNAGKGQLEKSAYGAGKPGLNLTNIREVNVAVPPLAEQHRIVAEVDRQLSVLDALDTTITANLARCAKLRQSILKRAFEGRLVPAHNPTDTSASPTTQVAE